MLLTHEMHLLIEILNAFFFFALYISFVCECFKNKLLSEKFHVIKYSRSPLDKKKEIRRRSKYSPA